MIICFEKCVKQNRKIKELPKEWVVPESKRDPYYRHFTVRVKTLSEYIEVIRRLSIIGEQAEFYRLVYRGHSDASSNYKLIPTIGRKEAGIECNENEMIAEMLTLRPEEFSNITSSFDLLSKLQHYGLPTRLLDFTYNPLIALYFACCDKPRTDCRVICTFDTSETSTRDTVEKISDMYKCDDYCATSLDQLIGGVSSLRRYANQTRYPLMAKPRYINDRIKHQSAIFMIFPNVICDYRSRMIFLGKKYGNEENYRLGFMMNEKERQRLEYVRKEPEVYNDSFEVNSKTLTELFNYYYGQFDDFYISENFGITEKYHFIFDNRFSVTNEIQELSEETISNSFVSILIDSKNKKSILHELFNVGIDKSFVYPELEYTAEAVKKKLF